jgi:hypothetical protein
MRIFDSRGLAVVLGAMLAGSASGAAAETVRLNVGEPLARADLLQPGVHRYVRYFIKGEDRTAIDVWTRTLSFAPHEGVRAMHITQRWTRAAETRVLIQDSWFEPGTFRPTSHIRRAESTGKVEISGYQWTPTKVVGMADLADNVRKDFVMPLPQPSYNFEYDMETLTALPLAAGRVFDIPFYDAGIDEPGRYLFKVAGQEVITGPDGKPLDCWLVTADYNTGQVKSRFWFAKRGQVLVREEAALDDGRTLVKALLPPEAGDAPSGRG